MPAAEIRGSFAVDRELLRAKAEESIQIVQKIARGETFSTAEIERAFTLLVVALPDALGLCDRLLDKIEELEEEMAWMIPIEQA